MNLWGYLAVSCLFTGSPTLPHHVHFPPIGEFQEFGLLSHKANEKSEAQRGLVTCLVLHSNELENKRRRHHSQEWTRWPGGTALPTSHQLQRSQPTLVGLCSQYLSEDPTWAPLESFISYPLTSKQLTYFEISHLLSLPFFCLTFLLFPLLLSPLKSWCSGRMRSIFRVRIVGTFYLSFQPKSQHVSGSSLSSVFPPCWQYPLCLLFLAGAWPNLLNPDYGCHWSAISDSMHPSKLHCHGQPFQISCFMNVKKWAFLT